MSHVERQSSPKEGPVTTLEDVTWGEQGKSRVLHNMVGRRDQDIGNSIFKFRFRGKKKKKGVFERWYLSFKIIFR